jgi:hypothetical protein
MDALKSFLMQNATTKTEETQEAMPKESAEKYKIFSLDKAIVPSDYFVTVNEQHQCICPICGYEYVHPSGVRYVEGNDNGEAGWHGRGSLMVTSFVGECGHEWDICFGFHKGLMFVFTRILSEKAIPTESLDFRR